LELKFLFRLRLLISLPCVLDTFQQSGHWRARINLAIDDQQWTRGNQWQHLRPVEAIRNSWHHTFIKLADEIGFDFSHAFIFRSSIDRRLKSTDAGLPGIVLKRPTK